MDISYRLTAVLYLSISLLMVVLPEGVDRRSNEGGPVCFDPRYMWLLVPWAVRICSYVWLAATAAVVIQGLRNRPALQLAGVVSAASLVPLVHFYGWYIFGDCITVTESLKLWTWIAAHPALCIQHFGRLAQMRIRPGLS